MKKDIKISDNGDLDIDSTVINAGTEDQQILRDFANTLDESSIRQSMYVRLKTNLQEFFLHPDVGNDLAKLIGKRNTRENAERGRLYIINAIVNKNYIDKSELEVNAIPIDSSTIVYSIQVKSNDNINFTLEVDLDKGIRRLI